LEPSLTVLLPVRNAESTLADSVHEILEIMSELTRRVEVLIIDDGSTDFTCEVAVELTSCYPQVRTIFNGNALGWESSVQNGLKRSNGDVVFLRDETAQLCAAEVRRLWRAAARREDVRLERHNAANRTIDAPHSPRRGASHKSSTSGCRLLDRRMTETHEGQDATTRPNYLNLQSGIALPDNQLLVNL
jgi:hypothetical protein